MAKHPTLLQPPKGFHDYLPPQASRRKRVIETLVSVFVKYGFEPLETPSLEYAAILEGKYGEEERLIFKFEDRGGRELALRFDQTVPLARLVAQAGDKLPNPFKRYEVERAWRAEKPQAGRQREFMQIDFDTIGASSPLADAEVIAVVNDALESLGFTKFHILFNDRRVLLEMIKASGIKKDLFKATTRILDKWEKIGEHEVILELTDAGVPMTKIEALMRLLGTRPLLPGEKRPQISLDPIDAVTKQLKLYGVPRTRVLYTPTLARGLDYYTGMILEATVVGYDAGSVGGGGRYDNLIAKFSGKKIPAVGFSFGLDRLIEAMDTQPELRQEKKTGAVLVTIFNEDSLAASAQLASDLRRQGLIAELYLDPAAKLEKQMHYASKKGVEFVAILGPEELATATVAIKNLTTGQQETIPLADVPGYLQ